MRGDQATMTRAPPLHSPRLMLYWYTKNAEYYIQAVYIVSRVAHCITTDQLYIARVSNFLL